MRPTRFGPAVTTALLSGAFVLGATPLAQAQSGFTRDEQSLYAKLAYGYFSSNDFHDLEGQLNDRGEAFTQHNLTLYAEYGVIDLVDVILNAPVIRVNHYETSGSAVGIGDLQIAVKAGGELGGFHLAGLLGVEVPTGNADATVQTSTGANLVLPTGDGEWNLIPTVAVSRSFWPIRSWASAHFGYNIRTEGYADQLRFGAELGHHLLETLYLQLRFRGQVVPSDDLDVFVGFIYGEGTEYLTIGAGAAYPIPETPLSVTMDWEVPFALEQNLYSGHLFVFGVAFEHEPSPE